MQHTQQRRYRYGRDKSQSQAAGADVHQTGDHSAHEHNALGAKLDNARPFIQNAAQCGQQKRSAGGDCRHQQLNGEAVQVEIVHMLVFSSLVLPQAEPDQHIAGDQEKQNRPLQHIRNG
ncbi:hypothetical protein D3C76_1551510 [compost metagenome]